MNKDYPHLFPAQQSGTEIIAEASASAPQENDAEALYAIAKSRLLNVNKWHKVAGMISATFQIVNGQLQEVDRNVEKGDYIKIDIPGPGSSEGHGYDWVCVEELREITEGNNIQSIGFRVRPSKNPFNKEGAIAHFYSDDATSNFMVTRENKTVSATIVDRNIKPNTTPESLVDKIRDTSAGIGAIGIFSKIQWQKLAEGIIEEKG